MQVGQRHPFGTVAFTGIDFGAKRQTGVVAPDATPFRLRYLLFEPRTGKIVSGGYGRGVRQTRGRPTPRTSIEDQLRNAGRDIADHAVSELAKAP